VTGRAVFFLPLAVVVLGGVALALLLGGRAATTTETEVIERVAAMYVATGGARTDCRAVPAQSDGLWLVITCEDDAGRGVEYFVDRFGEVADQRMLKNGA